MEKSSFKDISKETSFLEEGHLIINHQQEVISERILQFYSKYKSEHQENGFNTTHFSHNVAYKRQLLELSKDIFLNFFQKYFENYKVLFANLMLKNPGSTSILPTHADWTFSENDNPPTISLWIPTIDLTKENGMIGIIPKSHLLSEKFRGPEIISSYRKWNNQLKEEKGKLIQLTKLQTLAYDLRLLHYSLPNLSSDTRVALNITLTPQDSKIIHYTFHKDRIYKFENLDEDFYLHYHAHEFPESINPSAIFSYRQQISDQEIIKFYNLTVSKSERGFIERLKKLSFRIIKIYNL